MTTWVRSPAAATFRMPPGRHVGTCWRCRRPLHVNERTYIYEARTWRDVHRSCRYAGERERKGGK